MEHNIADAFAVAGNGQRNRALRKRVGGNRTITGLIGQFGNHIAGGERVGSAQIDSHVVDGGDVISDYLNDEGVLVKAFRGCGSRSGARFDGSVVNSDAVMEGVGAETALSVVGANFIVSRQGEGVTSEGVSSGSKVGIQLKAKIVVERIAWVNEGLLRSSGISQTVFIVGEPTIVPNRQVIVIGEQLTVGNFNHAERFV